MATNKTTPLSITDQVKTFADIERISGKQIIRREDETDDELAYRQVKLIAEVYNEGEVLNPLDTDQWKYFPWFIISKKSGFGLSYGDVGNWYACTDVGSRLCFKSEELAEDAGNKFIEIYTQLLIK